MNIRILACESLGVRSMACVVETTGMKVLIDPGTALGPKRFRLPPHPVEQETAQKVQKLLYDELANSTHVVIVSEDFSHFFTSTCNLHLSPLAKSAPPGHRGSQKLLINLESFHYFATFPGAMIL